MVYKSPLINKALADISRMQGSIKEYRKAADDEINKGFDDIPEAERKPFGETLEAQAKEVADVTEFMQEKVAAAKERLSR